MLTDLEARKDLPAGKPKKLVFEDLRPARGARSRVRPALWGSLVFTVAIAGAVYAWLEWEMELNQLYRQAYRQITGTPPATASSEAVSNQPVVVVVPPPAPLKPAIESMPVEKPMAKPLPPVKPALAAKPAPRPTVIAAAVRKPESIRNEPRDGQVDIKARPLTQEERAENAYRAAVTALKQKIPGVPEAEFRAALNLNPRHIKARELLASMLLERGQGFEAQQLLEEGLEKVPEYYAFAQLLARLYVEHGADEKAIATLEQVRPLAQKDPEFLAFLATLYQRGGRHADAVQGYRAALSMRPQEGKWWVGLGISLEAEKNWSAAAEAYSHARESGTLNLTLARHVDQRLAQLKNRLN